MPESPESLIGQIQRYRAMLRRADDSLLWNGIRKQIEILEARLARLDSRRQSDLRQEADDRRSSDRISAKIQGRLALGDRQIKIETVDLSSGGVLLLAKGARGIVPGAPVRVALTGIGELKGEVVGRSPLGLHLRFTDEEMTPKERLLQAIDRLNRLDGKFIDAAQAIAADIALAFEAAVQDGKIAEEDLFDTNYRPIAGTSPEQYSTKYTRLMDELLPPLQEPAFAIDTSVQFCTAVDLNGYLPADNRKFLVPMHPEDSAWAEAHRRHRRIAEDEVSLTAARNRRAFLMQTYEEHAEEGTRFQLKEVDAPINAIGRHWGGLRLAFHTGLGNRSPG